MDMIKARRTKELVQKIDYLTNLRGSIVSLMDRDESDKISICVRVNHGNKGIRDTHKFIHTYDEEFLKLALRLHGDELEKLEKELEEL